MNRKVHVRIWRQAGEGDFPRLASLMTQRGIQSIKYDPQRRPVRLDSGGTTVWRTAYDGDGVRRKRLDQTGTMHYLGAYERNVGNGQDTTEVATKYYHALGRLVAFRKNGTLHWVGTDHLGSTIRVEDASFTALDGMRYTPYGVSRDGGANLGTDHKFTAQVEDASIGLYWYHSRAYDPALGRFCQPDSIVPEPGNPQTLNRFSYVLNNPLAYVDPSGHRHQRREDYAEGPAGELQYQRDLLNELAEQGVIDSGPSGSNLDQQAANNTGQVYGVSGGAVDVAVAVQTNTGSPEAAIVVLAWVRAFAARGVTPLAGPLVIMGSSRAQAAPRTQERHWRIPGYDGITIITSVEGPLYFLVFALNRGDGCTAFGQTIACTNDRIRRDDHLLGHELVHAHLQYQRYKEGYYAGHVGAVFSSLGDRTRNALEVEADDLAYLYQGAGLRMELVVP